MLRLIFLGEINLWQLFWYRSVQIILNGTLYLPRRCLHHPIQITLRSFRLRLLQLRVRVYIVALISPTLGLLVISGSGCRVIIGLRLGPFVFIRGVQTLHKFLAPVPVSRLIVNQPVQVIIGHSYTGPMMHHRCLS